MRKRWEFEPKNIFSELLILLGRITQENLTYQIQYLKVENEILRKRIGKFIRPTPAERNRLLKFGAPLGKRIKDIITIVRYRTFLKWGRIPREQKSEKSNKRGRPKTIKETCELVVRLAKENAWGYVRILGELRKLGLHRLSKSSVKNILKENNLAPSPERSRDSWDCFIKRHFQTLWACDFFTKQVLTPLGPRMFFVLFFINIKTRKVCVAGTSRHPNREWVNKKVKSTLPLLRSHENGKKLLIRDRDTKFSKEFDELFNNNGFSVQKTAFMSPNMNAYAESWVGTIKRECLNHFIVFGERHLRHLIKEYVEHYNATRPHSSMDNVPLEDTPSKKTGNIRCQSKLGGLIKHYYRE